MAKSITVVDIPERVQRKLFWKRDKADKMVSRFLRVICAKPCEAGWFFVRANSVKDYVCKECDGPIVVDPSEVYPEAILDGIPCIHCGHRSMLDDVSEYSWCTLDFSKCDFCGREQSIDFYPSLRETTEYANV